MSKISFKNHFAPKEGAIINRRQIEDFYYNKYFSLWLDSIEWEGIDYQERAFIMRELWTNGRIGAIKLKGSEGAENYPNGKAIFVPFAPAEYNIYRFPTKANAINLKGVKFIPAGLLDVDKDIVLGWANVAHEPVAKMVSTMVERIVDVEMVIRMNLKAQKMPWLVAVTPETEAKMRKLAEALECDDPTLFIDLEDAEKAKALISGAPYIIDKLHEYIKAKENDLREYLGLYNLGFGEKKEHLLTSEIESNDEVTSASGSCFIETIRDWCERVTEILGVPISAELKAEKMAREKEMEAEEQMEESEEEDDE